MRVRRRVFRSVLFNFAKKGFIVIDGGDEDEARVASFSLSPTAELTAHVSELPCRRRHQRHARKCEARSPARQHSKHAENKKTLPASPPFRC